MPIQLKFVDNGIGVEFVSQGIVTGTDIIEANKEVYSNKNFSNQRYQIIDRTKCKEFRVSAEEIRIIAGQDLAAAEINPNFIVALISTSDLQYGMSRMYQSYIGDNGFRVEIFRDRKSAEKWVQKYFKSNPR